MPPGDSAAIAARLTALPKRQFPGRPVLQQIFKRLFEIYDQPLDDLKRVALVNQLLRCVLEVLHCADHHERYNCSPKIAWVVDMIRSSPERDFTLDDLAEEIDLSLSRFKAKFRAEMGIGPHEFIVRVKLEAAKRALLHERETVTSVAMRFGFSSSQYFATVFRRFTRVTPAEFRASSRHCSTPLREASVLQSATEENLFSISHS